jgi:guanidinoacetate N-methyltransferase
MRKLKRTPNYELVLDIKRDDFIAPPRESQRNWLLNRALAEVGFDLEALHAAAVRFVPGVDYGAIGERSQTELSDDQIMEDWQIPLMQAMAAAATERHGDVLEIGFGRGVASGFIQAFGVRSHTIVECNESVIERYHAWRAERPRADLRLLNGRWQEVTDQMGTYDGIFFHTYPLSDDEYVEFVVKGATFAEHFFPTAAAHLRPGGVLAYMTNEIDSLSRAHQRALLRHFKSFTVSLLPLTVPADVRDTWWADSMALVKAEAR